MQRPIYSNTNEAFYYFIRLNSDSQQNRFVDLSNVKINLMKKLLIVFIILSTVVAQAQKLKESDVPKSIKDAFAKRFPNMKGVEWSKESATEFEAEFKQTGKEQSANFDQTGKWLVTETEIKKSELPQAILSSIAKEFLGFKIEEAEKAETADGGMFYEVELEKGELNYEVKFSANGNVLSKEEIKEKDEDKD